MEGALIDTQIKNPFVGLIVGVSMTVKCIKPNVLREKCLMLYSLLGRRGLRCPAAQKTHVVSEQNHHQPLFQVLDRVPLVPAQDLQTELFNCVTIHWGCLLEEPWLIINKKMGGIRRACSVVVVRGQAKCLLERLAFMGPGGPGGGKRREATLRLEERRKKDRQAYQLVSLL